MKQHDFRRLMEKFGDLTPGQVHDAACRITEVRRRNEAIAEIESRAQSFSGCPCCGSEELGKWGRTKTNVQRYRCRGCGRTFTGRSGSGIERLHRPDLFFEVLKDMLGDRTPSSIRQLARRLRRNKHTIWRWRMIALRAMSDASEDSFRGIVEADETFQRESRKGSREWVRHQRDPVRHPKPPRMRWYEYGKKGIAMKRGLSRWQMPILTVADRGGAKSFQRIANRSNSTIHAALLPIVAPDAVLCSDGAQAYAAFAGSLGIEHFASKTKPARKTASATHHIQTVNNLHAQFGAFIAPFRGPATKYLDGYLQWFVGRATGLAPESVMRTI